MKPPLSPKKTTPSDSYLTDSHCHLLDEPLHSKLPEIFQAAFACQVQQFWVPCSHFSDFPRLQSLLQQHRCIQAAFGVHPFYTDEVMLPQLLDDLANMLSKHPQALVGEIGLDFGDKSLTPAAQDMQMRFFEQQLQLAQQYQRPVILHHRQSLDAMLAVITQQNFGCGGLLHAYAGSIEQARPWLARGFKLGVGSVLLKPNARKIRQLLPHLGLGDFVLETDAPYMVSSSMNQAYNEPKFVRTIAEQLATVYGCDWQDIARHSNANLASVCSRLPQNMSPPKKGQTHEMD